MKECAKYALQAYETHLTFKRLASRSYGMLTDSVMLYFLSYGYCKSPNNP